MLNSNISNKNVIFSTQFGSHLYGTNTEKSDIDFKTVYLPPINQLIAGTIDIFNTTRNKWTENNTEYEDELMTLHKFIKLAMEGQTMAIDMLWAPERFWASNTYWTFWSEYIIPHRSKFITSSMNAFIGYATNQAVKYSNKGNRLNNLQNCINYLSLFRPHQHLEEVIYNDKEMMNFNYNIVNSEDKMNKKPVFLFEINGLKFNICVDIKFVTDCLQQHLNKYGTRARTASLDNGADYKAISHAFRTLTEVEELVTTGNIEFPLKNKEFILSVKQGKIHDIEKTIDFLLTEVDRVADLVHNSCLPAKPLITTEEVILPFYESFYKFKR